jgi:hypothetical protein
MRTTIREWSSSSGEIELTFRYGDEAQGYHQGRCDDDVADLCSAPYLVRQFKAISSTALAKVLREYGAWSPAELRNRKANLQRLVWLACADLHDEPDCQRDDAHEWEDDRCAQCGLWRQSASIAAVAS